MSLWIKTVYMRLSLFADFLSVVLLIHCPEKYTKIQYLRSFPSFAFLRNFSLKWYDFFLAYIASSLFAVSVFAALWRNVSTANCDGNLYCKLLNTLNTYFLDLLWKVLPFEIIIFILTIRITTTLNNDHFSWVPRVVVVHSFNCKF